LGGEENPEESLTIMTSMFKGLGPPHTLRIGPPAFNKKGQSFVLILCPLFSFIETFSQDICDYENIF
jgi:hypothetical protein